MKESTAAIDKEILVVGAGPMAIEYTKVLQALGLTPVVIGRGERSAQNFLEATGIPVVKGGLRAWLANHTDTLPHRAIVANAEKWIGESARDLMEAGVKHILLEKPGGFDPADIMSVQYSAKAHGARVDIGYNRRFYAAVEAAREIIATDGGVQSFNFEFTEWSHVVGAIEKEEGVKEQWFLSNSTHVIDLAFHLGGSPSQWTAYTSGGLPWHPMASVFSGAGKTDRGSIFSYQANWEAPGRWGVEFLTRRHRLIFRPMEKLQVQKIGSVAIEALPLPHDLDDRFKPGLYRQAQAFLGQIPRTNLPTIDDQALMLPIYRRMRGDAV